MKGEKKIRSFKEAVIEKMSHCILRIKQHTNHKILRKKKKEKKKKRLVKWFHKTQTHTIEIEFLVKEQFKISVEMLSNSLCLG